MASGSQVYRRQLCGFADGANEQAEGDRGGHFGGQLPRIRQHFGIIQRLEVDEDQKDRDEKPRVADAVHDKGFRGRLGGGDSS